jgi:aromatic ring-opening dioxygenase catalytic subunit (LigB family)
MGEIVGVFCTSHSPGITGFPERADREQRGRVEDAFATVRATLAKARPDVIVAVSVEHFTNFFVSNLPAFAICTASRFHGPVTPGMASFLRIRERDYPGHQGLAEHLYGFALEHAFDPALVAGDFSFDENFCVPLELLDPRTSVPVVPVIVNGVNPPYPTLRRCYDLGRMIRAAVEAYGELRVAVLSTGGLSHFVGMPEAGTIDTEFDTAFLRLLAGGGAGDAGTTGGAGTAGGAALVSLSDADIDRAGNGAHEIRTWVVAAGAAGTTFTVLSYEPISAWLTGTAVAMADDH